ncbi:PKD domain-containing protein [Aestuariivirga sp.]|uniref:PKD domain-containing protein n=1 Tax=Aestuariivirga sp. TaxID=2650926 RepID=UPI0035B14E3E
MVLGIKRFARVLSVSLAIGSLFATAVEARQIVRERIKPAFPVINFAERQLGGQAAIDRLGSKLPEVANWYGTSVEQLRKQILNDHDVRIDRQGRMFVVEEMKAPLPGQTSMNQQNVLDGQLMPLDQTFLMHSRPGANRTIYLDFNGATLTGTAWNSSSSSITAKPYDIDGQPASFSDTELQRIQYIWQRVSEDYAPFDVDVTTEAPSPDRLSRSDTNDQVFGTTVLITHNSGVYSCSCGGIAYVGVFNSTTERYKPALVFYNMLGGGDEMAVAEAISHEAGHNMGLSHDGTASSAYYAGQGTDPVTGWAPIMGVGYYKPLVQFSKGEYPGANNKEDDFAVMQSYGLPLRADDYGNTIYTASAFGGGSLDGVIEQASDVDVFSIAASAGTLTATVSPADRSPDADLMLTLMDGSGSILASANPQNQLSASVTFPIPATGTYYLAVRGTGQGDPASTGYSAYGSVGNFRLTASYTGASGSPPQAVLTASTNSGVAPAAVTLDGSQSFDSDGVVKFYYWDFGDGTGDTTGSLQSVTKTYTTPGVYNARLTVVDNQGFSSSAVQTITVVSAASVKSVTVRSINVTVKVARTGVAKAKGVVVVVNQLGKVMTGAVVNASWSGVVSTASALRTRKGKVTFNSPSSTDPGCFALTVTSVTLAGYSFVPGAMPSSQICR